MSATLEESQDVMLMCVFAPVCVLFTAGCNFKEAEELAWGGGVCSPQSRSSELSPQSLTWLHVQLPGMHCSLSHRNSLSEHGLGSRETHTHTHTCSIWDVWPLWYEASNYMSKKQSEETFLIRRHFLKQIELKNLRQFLSSELSPQSLEPSHCQRMGMQRWLSQRKSPRGLQVTSSVIKQQHKRCLNMWSWEHFGK